MGKNKDKEIDSKIKENKTDDNEKVNIAKDVVSTVVLFAAAAIMAWLVVTFVGQRVVVDGDSMLETLHDGNNLIMSKISYKINEPERFDIVVFPFVEDGEKRLFIKRIIGLPGEAVRIDEDGVIYINEKPLDENYGREKIRPYNLERAKEGVTLGSDEYFVMGDNRNDSFDSRYEEVGNIKREELIGKAVFRIWPLSKFGSIK